MDIHFINNNETSQKIPFNCVQKDRNTAEKSRIVDNFSRPKFSLCDLPLRARVSSINDFAFSLGCNSCCVCWQPFNSAYHFFVVEIDGKNLLNGEYECRFYSFLMQYQHSLTSLVYNCC